MEEQEKTALTAISLIGALACTAHAESYSLQSVVGKNLPVLGPAADRFVEEVATLTNGEVQSEHLGAGDLSPPSE